MTSKESSCGVICMSKDVGLTPIFNMSSKNTALTFLQGKTTLHIHKMIS